MGKKNKISIVKQTNGKGLGGNLPKVPKIGVGVMTAPESENPAKKIKLDGANTSVDGDLMTILDDPNDKSGSVERGKVVLEKLIAPTKAEKFFEEIWEKKHLLVQHTNDQIFSNLISIEGIDKMLKENIIEYTKDIDIALYENGKRSTLNPEGRALPANVWEFFNDGASIRLLNPAQYFPGIYKLCAILQEYFNCKVGANVYLTPSSSQGFAPHYDDIEALALQVSGRKRWRLYAPLNEDEVLPRESSADFNAKEIGKPILDVTLKPGSFLYFPRGMIHQALCTPEDYSLHITLSVYQKNTWGDLLKKAMEDAIDRAMTQNLELRRGIPIDLLQNLGIVHVNKKDSSIREKYLTKARNLLESITNFAQIDASTDQYAIEYQHSALPPALNAYERTRSAYGSSFMISEEDKNVVHGAQLQGKSKIRLLKANILRMVQTEDTVMVYFHSENSLQYHEKEPVYLEANPEDAKRIEFLVQSYPEFVAVESMPTDKDEERKALEESEEESGFHTNLDFAQFMFDKGLLMVKGKVEVE